MSTIPRCLNASILLMAAVFATYANQAGADPLPSRAQMWEIIQNQQQTIDDLSTRLDRTEGRVTDNVERVAETDEKVEDARDAIEAVEAGSQTSTSWANTTTIGGYGELHHNNLENGGTGGDLDQVDLHRFVLFFGHEFTDRTRFWSELELEHALTKDTANGSNGGEVELEQAWLEFDLSDHHHLRAGLDLIPVGILNTTHEPPTFFGVERNPVETNIIPSTFWEAGIGLNGELAPGWNYDLVVHSGLQVPTMGASAFRIRSGRNKVSLASARDGAATARLRYTGHPGLEVGVTGQYQQDITQSTFVEDIEAWLFEAHVDYRRGPFGFRGLYARWELDDGPAGIGPGAFGADTLEGFYLEPSYRFAAPGPLPGEVGLFARYNQFDDRNRQMPLRYIRFEQIDAGVNYWPHPDVVFKFDYQWQDAESLARNEFDGFNLGMGYQF